MVRRTTRTLLALLFASIFVFGFGARASAEIIFEDGFDSYSDWNSAQGDSLLNNMGVWDGLQCNAGDSYGSYFGSYIDSRGAFGEGKGFRQYWDKDYGEIYAQDCWLIKNNIDYPDEWYLGYWYRHQSDWDWGGNGTNLKLLKMHFNNDTTWDLGTWTNFCSSCTTGSPHGYDLPYGCSTKAQATDEYGLSWVNYCWDNSDDDWHYWIWHVQHSTNTLEVFVDGVSVKDDSIPNYPGTGFDYDYGISFGGNIGGNFKDSGSGEYWTDYDSIILATTKTEVENFLGIKPSGATSSSAPEISSVSGTIYDGSTISISGNGFGDKSPAAPLIWDTFESGNVGSVIQNVDAVVGFWDSGAGSDNVFYETEIGYGNSDGSAKHNFTVSKWNSSLAKNSTSFPIVFMDFRRYYPSVNGDPGNYKPYRFYGYNDTMELFKGYGCGYQVHTVLDNGFSDTSWGGQNMATNTWQHYQLIYKESAVNVADGTIIATLDGAPTGHNSTGIRTRTTDTHLNQIRIGHYFDVGERDGCNPADNSVVYTDNVYIDTTWSRVEIGNASTYAASTHREIQIPSAWSTNLISVDLNQGSFNSGQTVYLYVVDADGNVNEAGYPITIVSATPVCGDGTCNGTETCSTCETDCGVCQATYGLSNFLALLADWLTPGSSSTDINQDNIVNVRDLGIIMSNWE